MLVLVILLYALFGFTFTLAKIILFYASPFFVVATRMIIGGIALSAYLTYYHKVICWPDKKDFWLYVQFIIFNICIFYGARSWSLNYLSTSKAALLMNISPFFTAILAFIFLKEKITQVKALGLMIGFLGMLPVLLAQSTPEANTWVGPAYVPELVFIFAVGCLSYSLIVMQKLVKHRSVSPLLVNSICMVSGGVAMGFTCVATGEKMIFGDPVLFWSVIVMQIIVSNILCSNLQAFLLRTYSTTFLAFASFISPLCAMGYGALLLNEVITWQFFVSFFIVFVGLTLFYLDDIKQGTLTAS